MRGLYLIAGVVLDFEYVYSDFFSPQINAYQVFDKQPTHKMKVVISSDLKKPETKPTMVFKNREIYEGENESVIVSRNVETGVITHLLTYDKEYKNTTIHLNISLKERLPELEYILTGIFFYEISLRQGYITLHASAIVYNNQVLLFSAPSGFGKSTLAKWWLTIFSESTIINDDKPIIMIENNQFVVSGSPWSGKDCQNQNIKYPLNSILFISQGKTNQITELSNKDKLTHLFRNIYRPREESSMNVTLESMDTLIQNTKIVSYQCLNDPSAATFLHHILFKE